MSPLCPASFFSRCCIGEIGRSHSSNDNGSVFDKRLEFGRDGPTLLSDMIRSKLYLVRPVAVLMGVNIAFDVAARQFVESTLACTDEEVSQTFLSRGQ